MRRGRGRWGGPWPGLLRWLTRPLLRREELPTIYKCPYQGCTAVYRGADGMKVSSGCVLPPGHGSQHGRAVPTRRGSGRVECDGGRGVFFGGELRFFSPAVRSFVLPLQKHIKEHHEEVRERPCPHPGCNKVFMIDRYLQRHVKLIHTGGSRLGQRARAATSTPWAVAQGLG